MEPTFPTRLPRQSAPATPIFDAIACLSLALAVFSFLALVVLAALYPAPTIPRVVILPPGLPPQQVVPDFVVPLQCLCAGYLVGMLGCGWWHLVCATGRQGLREVITTMQALTHSATVLGFLLSATAGLVVMVLGGIAFAGPILGTSHPWAIYGIGLGVALTSEILIPYLKGIPPAANAKAKE